MFQDEQARVQRIKEYVLERLREELGAAPRGAQAQFAKKLGVSGAHLSNMLSPNPTRAPGEDFRRKVAAHWGISYAQLEALALGEDPPLSSRRAPRLGWLDELPPNLARVLTEYAWLPDLPYESRLIVREQARQHFLLADEDLTPAEWQRIVTGLEREVLGLIAWRKQTAKPPALEPDEAEASPHPKRQLR